MSTTIYYVAYNDYDEANYQRSRNHDEDVFYASKDDAQRVADRLNAEHEVKVSELIEVQREAFTSRVEAQRREFDALAAAGLRNPDLFIEPTFRVELPYYLRNFRKYTVEEAELR